jgi:hypothetical protein
VTAFAGKAVAAAADLGEAMNVVRVQFGSAADSVIAFSETTSKIGIAQTDALQAAAGFGAMAQSAGIAEAESAGLSTQLVTLSADMASFRNTDPTEMLDRFRAGLAGEAEPLRRFGVFLSEARVKAVAYAEGIARAGAELTDAQKIQARYQIILQDTEKAQGDFARTVGESLPNQLRVMRAELQEAQAALGERLLPVVLAVTQSFAGLGSAALDLSDDVVEIALGIDEVVEALEKAQGVQVSEFFRSVENSVRGVIEKFRTAATTVHSFANMSRKELHEFREQTIADFDQMAGGLTNVSRKWALTAQAAVRATDIIAERQTQIARDLRKLDDLNIGDKLKQKLLELGPDMVHAFISGNRNQREKIRQNLKDYDTAAQDTVETVKGIASRGGNQVGTELMQGTIKGIVLHSEGVAAAARLAVEQAIIAAREAAEAQSPSKKMARLGRDLMEGLAEGLDEGESVALQAAERALDNLIKPFEDRLESLKKQLADVRARAAEFRSGILGAFAGFGDIGDILSIQEEDVTRAPTVQEVQAFFNDQVAAATQFADALEALKRQGASQDLLSQIAGQGPEALGFAQTLLQGGPEFIATVNQQLKAIQEMAKSTADALTERFFGEKIGELRDRLDRLHGVLQDIREAFRQLLREFTETLPALQHGGIVTRPVAAVVGEAGPEAVIPLSRLGNLGGLSKEELEETLVRALSRVPPSVAPVEFEETLQRRLVGGVGSLSARRSSL